MTFDEKIEELFIDMTEPPLERGNVIGAVKNGKTLAVVGALPFASGRIQNPGRVGVEVRLDSAKLAARAAAVMALSYAWHELGGTLNKIKRVVKVEAFVACGADFRDHTKVADGASELLAQVFGPSGKHARSVAGVTSLPQNACISLSIEFEVK
jgi:enamine deaminase RidA (YjgF/YER057c/UK114 family)